MKKGVIVLFALILFSASNIFADDVSIDSSGNVKTGVSNANAELEVAGASGEGGILGSASGTGASGVYGINTTYGNYGILGYDNYGVFGYSSGGWAGYFSGNARVTGNLTIDGSILGSILGDITEVTAGTGLTGGATSGNATLNADTTYLQRRISSSCTVGSSIRAINADGTVLCQTDNVGLTSESDPKVGSNTVNYIPKWDGSALVTASIFDNGNIGIGTSSPSQKLTVAGTIKSTNGGIEFPDGTVLSSAIIAPPSQTPRTNTITTVDSVNDVGDDNSITIGTDGLPVISYLYRYTQALKVAKCGNASCSSGNTITTVDSPGMVGFDTSIAIGTDGLPIISYTDLTNLVLKVVKCGNAACSSGNTITTIDSANKTNTSITIGMDGLPVIAYLGVNSADLKVVKCGNGSCSSGNTITTIDSVDWVGNNISATIGMDGLLVIAYLGIPNNLKVAKCGNISCSSGNTITIVDPNNFTGMYPSITIGTDGLPVISYWDFNDENLNVVKCGNASCSSNNTITLVDSDGSVGRLTSLTIGRDGLPVISYLTNSPSILKIAKCGNAACSSGNTIIIADSSVTADVNSITIGTDGFPVVSYHDNSNDDLKVVKCANQFCLNNWSRR